MNDLKDQLALLRDGAAAQWDVVTKKRADLKEAEDVHKRLRNRAEALAEYIHKLDGTERDCPGHEYVAQPSGRGIGYDERCRHCGYFKTLYPVY